jgi:glycosyltransferase involved in cell wall biosynthesis
VTRHHMTSRLRVLLEVNSGDLKIGATNDALDLAALLQPLGVEMRICGTRAPAFHAEATRRRIRARGWRSRMWSRRGALSYAVDVAKWRALLSSWRPDVVHLNYAGYGPSLACAARSARIPVVARAGGAFHPANPANEWVAAYIANCAAHGESYADTPLADRVVITGDLFRRERLQLTRTLERPLPPRIDGVPRVLFLGQLVPRKGIDVLVRAVAQMRRRAQLLLVGGDWSAPGYPAQLRELITSTGIAHRVVCESHRQDVGALLDDADVLVLPSRSEARPRTVIEAMLEGLPVVASAVGGVPELVVHGETGLLFESGDVTALAAALDDLIASPATRAAMGAAGRARAAEICDPDRTARAYLRLYERLAALNPSVHRADARTYASS